MNKIKENFGGILMCLCEILVGILLLISPVGFTAAIIIGAGALLLVNAVISIVAYFRTAPLEAAKGKGLVKGLCGLAAGLFCIFRSQWFIATFPLLTMVYGIAILLTGLVRVQWTVDMLRLKKKEWYWSAAGAALALIFAAIILLNPFESTAFLWSFVAVSLIIEAVLDVISMIFTGRKTV